MTILRSGIPERVRAGGQDQLEIFWLKDNTLDDSDLLLPLLDEVAAEVVESLEALRSAGFAMWRRRWVRAQGEYGRRKATLDDCKVMAYIEA